ncbi:hypothetical protein V2J09_019729 [Rumex salicifolius]
MARDRDDYDEGEEDEYVEEEEEEEEDYGGKGGKRRRSDFIDDVAEEDDEEEEEEYEEEEYRGGASKRRASKRGRVSALIDDEAIVDSDEEEEEEEGEDDFIVDSGADLPEEEGARHMRQRSMYNREDDLNDLDDIEEYLRQKYVSRASDIEYEETTDVEQQALLPSVRDPKLFMVKCAIGKEREVAVCLMQKYIDKGSELQIKSAVALDHLKNYIYIEADKESHVREAIKGMRNIFGAKITIVPIKEMTDVLSVESKSTDIARDTWVRMKSGNYKGDLAKVVDVDNVKQRVTVKLIPRVDLQALANKLDGRDVTRKKQFVVPQRLMNIEEARDLHIPVERRKDQVTGDYYETIDGQKYKDGFLMKPVSMKTISTQNVQPTFDELEKFRQPSEGDGDMSGLSTLFANRKKGHFMKGDAVIVIKGDLKNLKGWVEKSEEDYVHIRPNAEGLPKTLSINEKDLCKYFELGNHVKVISGVHEGATGMVVKVDGHVLNILSDTTKEDLRVFADHVVESSEVTTGITKIGNYELRDLVVLDNKSFGVIIRVDSEAFQVLKGVPDRPEVVLVRLREIKSKVDRKMVATDRARNTIAVNDVVRVCEGPCQGKQGPVQHIFRGLLFIFDRHHLEHAGFICAKSESCRLVGGARSNGDRSGGPMSFLRTSQNIPQSPGRLPPRAGGRGRGGGGRGQHDALVGKTVKVRLGPYKGYRGRVKDVKGNNIRIELDTTMKDVMVDRNHITDNVTIIATPYRDNPRFGMGSETPMHPSKTPMHPFMTPMRDPGATPIHDGMRTPMRDRAWNPYAPMSPPRDNWDDANPATWGTTPQYRPGSPPSRSYEAPTPGSGWTNTPGGNYNDAGTPRDGGSYANAPSPYLPSTPGQPMTPGSTSYLPGTPAGQPMTPGGGLDMMSPAIGGENDGPLFMSDVLVNVHRAGDDPMVGIVRDVLLDGSCRVALGMNGNGETVTLAPSEIEAVPPRKSDKIKIMGGPQRGYTGKLIGVDGTDGIVKMDESLDVKILDMAFLGKVALA